MVKIYLNRGIKQGRFDEILKDSINYTITTGSAALGRGTDFQTLTTYTQAVTQLIPQEQLSTVFNVPEYLRRLAYSLDVNTAQLIKSEDEVAQEQQVAQQAEVNKQVAPIQAKAELEQ